MQCAYSMTYQLRANQCKSYTEATKAHSKSLSEKHWNRDNNEAPHCDAAASGPPASQVCVKVYINSTVGVIFKSFGELSLTVIAMVCLLLQLLGLESRMKFRTKWVVSWSLTV